MVVSLSREGNALRDSTHAFVGLSHWILTGQNSLTALSTTTTSQRSTLNFLRNHVFAGSIQAFALRSSAVTLFFYYLHEYQTHQDIQLDPNQIEKNLAYVPWPNSCLTLSGANLANAPIRYKYPAVQNQVNFFRSSQMIDK